MSITGKRIFILGDSHSYGSSSMGTLFAQGLRDAGAGDVRVNAVIGRSAHSFWSESSPGAAEILASAAQFDPDIVYLVLGSNDTGLNLDVDAQQFMRIASAFPNAQIWGVGPPTLPLEPDNAAAVAEMMARVFGSRFIDLRPLSLDDPRAPDQLHFSSAGAASVARKLTTVAAAKLSSTGLPAVAIVGIVGVVAVLVGLGLSKLIARKN